eukprot:gb/GECH01010835.1/.p1 GENE.gb/GECH01010835.1/~~gb/GECH01010835.1/.p1  ORF type:complete len:598 (+),score=206.37 gb/GECH01010835.1/:1-1794(+)
MAQKRSKKQSNSTSEPPTKKRKIQPKVESNKNDKVSQTKTIPIISNENPKTTKKEKNNNKTKNAINQEPKKPRKLRVEKKKKNNIDYVENDENQTTTTTNSNVTETPLRKKIKARKSNPKLKKTYFDPTKTVQNDISDDDETQVQKVPLRNSKSKKKRGNKRAIQNKIYFPPSHQQKDQTSSDEEEEDYDSDNSSKESGPALEGVAGDESLVVDSDTSMDKKYGSSNRSEEEDDDESLSDYDEDDESDDSVDSEKEEMDDSQESEEESEEEDDDDSEEESEEEDTINKKKKNKNSKPREAQLLSNQGTGAADIGLIDINRKIEYDEGQADTIVDGDEEEDYDDDSDDNDEDDVQKEQSLKRTAKAENETSDTIIHHGFGGDEGWSDLLQATKKVKPLSSKTPRDSKQQAKKKSKRSRDKMEISKNFQGLIRVSNFPHGFFDDEMRGFFSQFGNIGNCIVARNPKTHQPLGYAYIEFLSPEIAEIAADAMHGYMMLHTVLDVKAVDHPGPHFWKKTEFNIKPIARFDEPSFMLGKYQEHRNRQMKKMKRRETEERMKKMREGIRNKEKEMREKYGIEYRYKMDSLLPDCSGARVTLGQ